MTGYKVTCLPKEEEEKEKEKEGKGEDENKKEEKEDGEKKEEGMKPSMNIFVFISCSLYTVHTHCIYM